ncbi:MAG: alpha/beta hydrolase [Flavobacteriaceae bacterium]|jgi:acetyl esterase/lipase|nr:alpha/beta hydrolase [Flavobacteriaceae bacterium]
MKKTVFALLFLPFIILAQPPMQFKKADRNVIFGMYSGLALLMDIYYPDSPNGIGLVHVSGSGFNKPLSMAAQPLNHQSHVSLECQQLINEGYTVFSINHRATPRFKFPDPIDDAQRAVRYIRHNADKFKINPDKIGAIGGSSGGNIVLMIALLDGSGRTDDDDPINRESAKVQAVIARAPVTTFLNQSLYKNGVYLGLRGKEIERANSLEYQIAKKASPVAHATPDDPPVLLMHGDLDKTVPIIHSQMLVDSLNKYGVENELMVIKNAGHGPSFKGGLNVSEVEGKRIQWFKKHLLDQ